MKMPPKILACICENEDGTYTMFLDQRRDFLSQIDDYEHELWHIIRDDMHSSRSIYVIEAVS